MKSLGDTALEALHENLIDALRSEALARACEKPLKRPLLEADAAFARHMLNATLAASGAATALRELDLDDVQQTREVHFQTFRVAGVENGL